MLNNLFDNKYLSIIAGPCALESQEQVEQVARCLKLLGLHFIRAGIFKPRVSPYSFQGLGKKGIGILSSVASYYKLKTVSEVTDNNSLQLLSYKVDILQIGTRNMTNYSLLKDIAKATEINHKPIIFKRGMSAKISEYLSTLEYLKVYGNENIILCERGIRTFEDSTRFTLDISAVPVIHSLCKYPVCVDVSHSSGNSKYVFDLAKAAVACGADCLMLEVHPNPKQAKCDGKQQLDLDSFKLLIEEIKPIAKAVGKTII